MALLGRGKRRRVVEGDPGLREMALNVRPDEIKVTPTAERPHVWGVLMETGYPKGVASLVCFADGATSLYFSNGGGIIGAGEHGSVRAVAQAWLTETETYLPSFEPAHETPLPSLGRVRFYVRTFDGTLTAEADEQDLGRMRHPLSPFFHHGHTVMSAIRHATQRSEG